MIGQSLPLSLSLSLWQAIEKFFAQSIGSVVKIEIEDSTPGNRQ